MGLFWDDATAKVLRQEQSARALARVQIQNQAAIRLDATVSTIYTSAGFQVDASRVTGDFDAGQITTGVFDPAQVPDIDDLNGTLLNTQMPNGGIGVANPSGTFADLAAAEAWAVSVFNELSTRGAIN